VFNWVGQVLAVCLSAKERSDEMERMVIESTELVAYVAEGANAPFLKLSSQIP
jgi:hypothetical protein